MSFSTLSALSRRLCEDAGGAVTSVGIRCLRERVVVVVAGSPDKMAAECVGLLRKQSSIVARAALKNTSARHSVAPGDTLIHYNDRSVCNIF